MVFVGSKPFEIAEGTQSSSERQQASTWQHPKCTPQHTAYTNEWPIFPPPHCCARYRWRTVPIPLNRACSNSTSRLLSLVELVLVPYLDSSGAVATQLSGLDAPLAPPFVLETDRLAGRPVVGFAIEYFAKAWIETLLALSVALGCNGWVISLPEKLWQKTIYKYLEQDTANRSGNLGCCVNLTCTAQYPHSTQLPCVHFSRWWC